MSGNHAPLPPSSDASAGARHERRLMWAFGMTFSFLLIEAVGAVITGSLALLADAAHMLTDAGGLLLALLAIRFARRPATPQRTYGYLRAEILSALANAVVLLALTAYILYEAYRRFFEPPEVLGGPMFIVAIAGTVINLISLRLLSGGANESLNVKGAYFEVLGDLLGSIGVIVAAVVILLTGWQLVDPIIGAAIGLFIIPRTWGLLSQAVHILLEGTPPEVDVNLLEQSLLKIEGVVSVHDLHVWTVTSGLDSASCHIVIADGASSLAVLASARKFLADNFGIDHATVQIEDAAFRAAEKNLAV